MRSSGSILLLVDEEGGVGGLLRPSRGAGARVRVRLWSKLKEEDLSQKDLRAVVFRSPQDSAGRRRHGRMLKSLPEGVARVSLVPRGGAAPERGPGEDLRLAAPVDLRVLTALISRERQVRDLEESLGRSRRVAAALSRRLRTFSELTRSSNAEFDPGRILDISMQKVRKLIPLGSWAVFLLDEEKSCLTLQATYGPGVPLAVGTRLGMGEGIAGRVLRSRAPLLVSPRRGGASPRWPEIPETLRWKEILGLPLLSRGKAIGVVELIRGRDRRPYLQTDIRSLSMLLEPVAIAVENALLLKRSEELSITDDLTKLHNSRYLNSYLLREVQRSRRYGAKVSLIFLDLDGFKNVNDNHGHLAGSRALVEVGAVIRNMVREIDVVSRFGGDEFTVILPQTGPEGARVIAERIRLRVEDTVFLETFGLKVRITASFGIASFPDHAESKEALIQKADQAMYRVKGRGKNGVEMSS